MTIPESQDWDKPLGQGRGGAGAIRGHISHISRTPVLVAIILLTGALCLGLGLLVQKQNAPSKDPLWIEQLPAAVLSGSMSSTTWTPVTEPNPGTDSATNVKLNASQAAAAAAAVPSPNVGNTAGTYVASKTGTKYYLPSCATAKRIKDENKVWFNTKAEAEAKGYGPASNCKGL
ncbi:MAG: protein of unknown function with transrane region [Parcubacteria group bacterium]|nr:protein of unknown function with transrane region [Parcubacteria group bacterium]